MGFDSDDAADAVSQYLARMTLAEVRRELEVLAAERYSGALGPALRRRYQALCAREQELLAGKQAS